MKASYSLVTTAAAALSAGVAKTILAVRGGAAFGLDLRKLSVGFDGVTASAVPVLVELCSWSGAGAGTSTAATPTQTAGRVIAHGVGGSGQNFTVEPTALVVLKSYLLTPNGGLLIEEFAPDKGYDSDVLTGFALRCTAPAAVNARGLLEWERV
jgi:hypothetical protein